MQCYNIPTYICALDAKPIICYQQFLRTDSLVAPVYIYLYIHVHIYEVNTDLR